MIYIQSYLDAVTYLGEPMILRSQSGSLDLQDFQT